MKGCNTKNFRDTLADMESLGIEVLGVARGKGAHQRVTCRYASVEFFYTVTTSRCVAPRAKQNTLADLRKITRAIDAQDDELLRRYIGKRI